MKRPATSFSGRLWLASMLAALLLVPLRPVGLATAMSHPDETRDDSSIQSPVGLADAESPQTAPGSQFDVAWNGTLWSSMPNFTWSACGVSDHTRSVIDLALGQWSYAGSNQGIPIQFSELPCTGGNSQAQIRVYEANSADLALNGDSDVDVFALTLNFDANNKRCAIDVPPQCVAQVSKIYLFTDTWEQNELTYAQAAKSVAHEFGHAIGLGHAHFCNFESVMAQDCEPAFQGLGGDDLQSIDALVDYVRNYFNQPPLNAQPVVTPSPTGPSPATTVTYRAGYNLVAGPRGTLFTGAAAPIYTMLSGDSGYRSIPGTQGAYDGYGYWAYFARDTTVQLSGSGPPFYSAVVDPHKWLMIGNDGSGTMRVLGADAVYAYDTQTSQYKMATTIQPGQGAWVLPDKNGLIAVAATSLTRDQVRCYLNLGNPMSC